MPVLPVGWRSQRDLRTGRRLARTKPRAFYLKTSPGYIDTEMVLAVPEKVLESIIAQIPVGRLGKAEEIAKCVAFLTSDDAGFITGATIAANGGQFVTG